MKLYACILVIISVVSCQKIEDRFSFGDYDPWSSGSVVDRGNVWDAQPVIVNKNQNRPQTTSTFQQPNLQVRGISRQKCEIYKAAATKKSTVTSLALGSTAIQLNDDACDRSTGLIFGGQDVKVGEFPHMAAIGYRDSFGELGFSCGGTLISEDSVLTAAHCQRNGRSTPSIVRLGDRDIRKVDPGEMDVPIARFISHPNYNSNTKKNDIAVIKMTRQIRNSKFIRPACLPQPNLNLPATATVTGWGRTENSDRSTILQKAKIDIIDNSQCRQLYDYMDRDQLVDGMQLCAGILTGNIDSCQGDSGGPLQISLDKCSYAVIGVVSFGGTQCAQENSPGIYARVSSYIDWIEDTVWGRP